MINTYPLKVIKNSALCFVLILASSCSDGEKGGETQEESSKQVEKEEQNSEPILIESAIKIQDGDNNRELLYEVRGDEAVRLLGSPDIVYELKIDLYDGIEVSNDDLINCLSVINFTTMDSINVNDYMSCLNERYENKILCGSNKNMKFENSTTVNSVTFSVHH